ncbi:MAG: flagellar biosynthesis protein FlhA [Clostridia bacterium]
MIKIKSKFKQCILAAIVIGIIVIIVVPLSTTLLDILLIINITFSLMILLTTLYVKEPLNFSIFPMLLLITTLFRLSLNISSTRIILGEGGAAGKVIAAFGSFVVQGNIVVGLVIYLIIMIIQFIVITKGAERVSEVAARFTLDSMPGKQMAIDADLNAGFIDEKEAKIRRKKVEYQADFYGSMDGATKFVKGDAIAGIIITLINFIGGMIIGVTSEGMEFAQVIEVYSLATVGDGLVSQIPSLMISTATGIIATRSTADQDLNEQFTSQLFSDYKVLFVSGAALLLLSIVPGFPGFFLLLIGGALLAMGYAIYSKTKKKTMPVKANEEVQVKSEREPVKTNIMELLNVDPVKIELGYSLIPLIDEAQGGDLLERMITIRNQFASSLGIVIPVVRFRDNLSLKSNEYAIMIRNTVVEKGVVLSDHMLAMNSQAADEDDLEGIDTKDPAYGMHAKWITKDMQDKAQMLGYTVISPSSVIATHISKIVKKHSYEIIGRQEIQKLVDNLKEKQSVLVDEVIGKTVTIGQLHKVLMGLLKEGIPVKSLDIIIETLGDYAKTTKDMNVLIEYVRQALKREITQIYAPSGKIDVITVHHDIEDMITKGIRAAEGGGYLALEPEKIKDIIKASGDAIRKAASQGIDAIILTSPIIRIYLVDIVHQIDENIDVLSYNEIENKVKIQIVGSVVLQ